MHINLSIEDHDWTALDNARDHVTRAVDAALDAAGRSGQGLSVDIVLSDDDTVRKLNQRWRGKASATNVLSFPAAPAAHLPDDAERLLGDIILASGVVDREARGDGKTFATHSCHLVIHGMLHLLGYDHDTDHAAEQMEQLEIKAMALLGMPDPYRHGPAELAAPLVT